MMILLMILHVILTIICIVMYIPLKVLVDIYDIINETTERIRDHLEKRFEEVEKH